MNHDHRVLMIFSRLIQGRRKVIEKTSEHIIMDLFEMLRDKLFQAEI